MSELNKNQYELEIRRNRWHFFVFFVLSLGLPLSIMLGAPIPEGEPLNVWFQRSGATMVVFALLAEARASQMYDVLKPSGMVSISFREVKKRYGWQAKAAHRSAFLLVIVGTVIWGYGDILVQ